MDGIITPLSTPSPLVGSTPSQGRGWSQTQQLLALGQLFKAVVVEAKDGGNFTLDIGGSRLTATSSAPLAQGQALQLQVVKTEPFIELKIVNDNAASPPFAGRSLTLLGKNLDLSPLMQTIRQLDPAVLQSLTPATRKVLENFSALQQNFVGNKDVGATVKQLVDHLGPNLEHFTVKGDQTGATQTLKAALLELVQNSGGFEKNTLNTGAFSGKGIEPAPLLQSAGQFSPTVLASLDPVTRNVFESFFATQQSILGGKDGGAALKELIGRLGLNLEHLLARGDKDGAAQTLKAALLDLAHTFAGSEKIAEGTGRLISALELFQLTQVHSGTDNNYILPLPLPFVEQGYLLIERDGRDSESGGQDPAGKRFSLHLTMSDLGNLRIDFLRNAEGLFIRFAADSKEKAEFLAGFEDELQSSITTAPLIGLSFSGGAPDPISDLIRRLVPEGRSILDTKV